MIARHLMLVNPYVYLKKPVVIRVTKEIIKQPIFVSHKKLKTREEAENMDAAEAGADSFLKEEGNWRDINSKPILGR